jgi:hypothetical protein
MLASVTLCLIVIGKNYMRILKIIEKILAWLQIVFGGMGFLFSLWLIFASTSSSGHGFAVGYGVFLLIPISLWFLISGILLLRIKVVGRIMLAINLLFVGRGLFALATKPFFASPPKKMNQALMKELVDIPQVQATEAFYQYDTTSIHLYCDDPVLNSTKAIDEITLQVLDIVQKISSPTTGDPVRIIFHPYFEGNPTKSNSRIEKDIYFRYSKKQNAFVKIIQPSHKIKNLSGR